MFCASLAFIDGLGAPEMVLIFVLVLVLFGGQKLPEFARGLGKSIREFKKAAAGVEEEFKRALEEDERKHATPLLPPPTPDPTPTTTPVATTDHGGPYVDPHHSYPEHDGAAPDSTHAQDHTVPETPATPTAEEPTIQPPESSPETKPSGQTKPSPPPPPPAVQYPENPS